MDKTKIPQDPVHVPVPHPKKKSLYIAGGVLIVIILIMEIIWARAYIKNLALKNTSSKTGIGVKQITPTPTPRAIPSGKKGFTVGQSDKTVPQLSRGSIDPYDPDKGSTQTVTITVKHTQPVTKVTAVLKTDHSISKPTPLTLISGTNTDGEWSASWRITDTYLYTYALVFNAASSDSSGSVTIVLR